MSKFNTAQNTQKKDEIENYEGGRAFKMGDKLELFTLVATSMLQEKYYTSAKNEFNRLIELIKKNNPEFVAKLAIYTRNDLYLRSIPVVLIGELFKILPPGERGLLRQAISGIVQRVDDMMELAAYLGDESGLKHLPKQYLKAIEDIFNEDRFDEYQFAKYDRKDKIRPRDLMRLAHPKPLNDTQAELFKKLKEETLATPYTWETQISEKGNKAEVWEELIDSGRFPYFALLRNLRNITKAKVSQKHIDKVCEMLTNKHAVAKAKILPFRFFSAWAMLEREDIDMFVKKQIKQALETAIANTVPTIIEEVVGSESGRVLIACDTSGSMQVPISPKSIIKNVDIGLLLGGTLQKYSSNGILGAFGTDFATVNTNIDVLDLPHHHPDVGWSTDGWKVIRYMNDKKLHIDKLLFFTDCQLYDSYGNGGSLQTEANKYWSQVNPKLRIYVVDLAGYGHSPLRLIDGGKVSIVSGWSEAIFKMLALVEKGETIVNYVESLSLDYWREKKVKKEEEEE